MSIKNFKFYQDIEHVKELQQNIKKLKNRIDTILLDVEELEGDMSKNLAMLENREF